MGEGLFCYAGKNAKMDLHKNDDEKTYKNKYVKFLKNIPWKNPDYSKNYEWGPSYVDPDRKNEKFYSDLCGFLNCKKEKNYKYDKATGHIKCVDDNIELVSDQFGFSAPGKKLNHPYDIYLIKCIREKKDEKKAIDNVVRWVMESRTIGGSFLWPKDIWGGKGGRFGYNTARGGGNPFNAEGKYLGGRYSRYYIEDRVDLTLLEIKHYLDNKNNNFGYEVYKTDTLYKYIQNNPVGKAWLDKFESFEEYVKYFCFGPFVVGKGNGCMPYDILSYKPIKEEDVKKYKEERENNSIFNLDAERLEKMFNNVNFMIKERSKEMNDKVK